MMDAGRAVDTVALQAARTALLARAEAARQASGESFVAAAPAAGAARSVSGGIDQARNQPEAFKRFEAMVLQTFIQNMMPKDTGSVYGGGMAGDMWKSMMAEQLAGVMSERGGIGIAGSLLGDRYVSGREPAPVAPAAADLSGPAEGGRQDMLSTALVQEMQRRIAQSLDGFLSVDEPKR